MEHYSIVVKGHISDYWSETMDEAIIERLENGNSRICGNVLDQAQLHGILSKIRDLGLTLVSLEQVTPT